jgi:hypothetical protein
VAFVAGAVSDVFTVVSELVGSLIEFNKTNSDTLSGAKDSDPTPTDVATIIRDFDKSDILILKLGKGSSLKTQKYTADNPVTINGQGYEMYNPLLKADNKYDGTVFTYTPTAGNSYDNIILDGYSDKLYQLGLETSGGISTYVLGGSAYAPSANNGFKFNEFNVK